ncbi:BRCA2 repeat [Trinorchestia longiramus]|nr:BRCA2 repeat [Trinorchestia longiramus]
MMLPVVFSFFCSHRCRVVCGPCSVSGLCLCRKTSAGSKPGNEYELFLVSRRELALIVAGNDRPQCGEPLNFQKSRCQSAVRQEPDMMSCNNSKCRSWLCILRSRALSAHDNLSHRSCSFGSICNQHSLLASPSSSLQDHLNNASKGSCFYESNSLMNNESCVASEDATGWPLNYSVHHNRCSTTQLLKEQLGVDATSESFAWTSALETPAKSIRPQDSSLHGQSLCSSFLQQPRSIPSKIKPHYVTQNDQNNEDSCNGKHPAARGFEQHCDLFLPDQARNLCDHIDISEESNEEKPALLRDCQLSHQNNSKNLPMTDVSATTTEKKNFVRDREYNLHQTSNNHVTKDLHNSCSYIVDSVSPKLRRRTRNKALDKKTLARTLFKTEASPDCSKLVLDPATAQPDVAVTLHGDQEGCVDIRIAVATSGKSANKPSVPCMDAGDSVSNEPPEVSREEEMEGFIDTFMKERNIDESAEKYCELKKSPTIASRTPLNRLRTLPFKTSTPLLGTALFSALRSCGKENFYNDEKTTEISIEGKHETSPVIVDNETSREVSHGLSHKKYEYQTSATDEIILIPTEDRTNPIDLLCSPVKTVQRAGNQKSFSAVTNEEATYHRLKFGDMASPVLSPSKCTHNDHKAMKEIVQADEAISNSSVGKHGIHKTVREVISPALLGQINENITSISSGQYSKDNCLKTFHSSREADNTDKTAPERSSCIEASENSCSSLSVQTIFEQKLRTSANESLESASCVAVSNSSIDAPVTKCAGIDLQTPESSCVVAPASESCVTSVSISALDQMNGSNSCTAVSSPERFPPASTPVTHRKPRTLSLSARGAQKLEMLKKKINPNSNFIYPSPLLERSCRSKTLENSESILTDISSCVFIDADVTTTVPPVGKAPMKSDHQTTVKSSSLAAAREFSEVIDLKAGSTLGNVRASHEDRSEHASTSTLACTTSTSSAQFAGFGASNDHTQVDLTPTNLRDSHDCILNSRKSSTQSELHQETANAKTHSHNYMNSEELAEVDDILQNCDFDFDDIAQISGDKKAENNASRKLHGASNVTNSVLHPCPTTDSNELSSHPTSGCNFAFQTGRGTTVHVSKQAVSQATRLWKETDNDVPTASLASEPDSFTVPSVCAKFGHENNSDSVSRERPRTETTKNNSFNINEEAVVPEVHSKNVNILFTNAKTSKNVETCAFTKASNSISIGFGGFKTAAGNDVKVDEEAMNKALRLWGECGDLSAVTGKAEDFSPFSEFLTADGAKVEANSLALAERRQRPDKFQMAADDISKDGCFARSVDSDMPRDGFVTASGKAMSTSADAIEKAKRIWSDCGLPGGTSTAIDLRDTSGFSSAKGCRLPLSHSSLLKAQRLWDECAQSDTPDGNSSVTSELKFDGFKTASGTQVCVSEKAIQAAKSLLNSTEETDSQKILLKSLVKEEINSNPLPKTPIARPLKKGFIKHKINPMKVSGLSSGLPEQDSCYSKIRSDLSGRIYRKNDSSEKPSSKGILNDASAEKPTMVCLSAEEKAILDSQFQDIAEEFLNDDWNMELEISKMPREINRVCSNKEVDEDDKSLVVQGEKRKISFEKEKDCKREKITSTLAENSDAELTDASVSRLRDGAIKNIYSQESSSPINPQKSHLFNEELKSSSERDSFAKKCLFSNDDRAQAFNAARSANTLNNSSTVSDINPLCDGPTELCSIEAVTQQPVNKKTQLDLHSYVEVGSENVANLSFKNDNPVENGIDGVPSANSFLKSEKVTSLPASSSRKFSCSLNSGPDAETFISANVIKPSITTDSLYNSTVSSTSIIKTSSTLQHPTVEVGCMSQNSGDGTNCAGPNVSPVLVRSRQMKKKIQYLQDVYGTPKSLTLLPASPAVLRKPFRPPSKRKLSLDK